MSKTTPELLLEIMQIYKQKEWETKKNLNKDKLVNFLDKILDNISANETIDNKTEKKIINKLFNEADKNIIVDIKNSVLDKKRSYKLIKEVKDNNVIDTEYNDLESESNINNYWKKKKYCNFKFTLKEILFVIFLLILLCLGAHVAHKDIISQNSNRISFSRMFNDVLYFISNLLSIT